MLVHGRPYEPSSGRPEDAHVHLDEEGHERAHSHKHTGAHRREQPHAPQRAAVLDIGGDVGALLVVVGPALDGAEIELYDEHGTYVMHTEVHGREVLGKHQYAGLFPAVRAGSYLLDTTDGSPRERVVVTGGQVARVGRG